MRIDEVEQLDELLGGFGLKSLVPFSGARASRLAANKSSKLSAQKVKKFSDANTAKWVTILQNLKKVTPGITPDQINQSFANFVNSLKIPETSKMDLTRTDPKNANAVLKLFSQIGSAIVARQAATPPAPTPAAAPDAGGGAATAPADTAELLSQFKALLDKMSAPTAAPAAPAAPAPAAPTATPESTDITKSMLQKLRVIESKLQEALTPEESAQLDALYAQLSKSPAAKTPAGQAMLDQYRKAKGIAWRPGAGGTSGQTSGIEGYIQNWTKTINAEKDPAKKIVLAKEVINFLADRKAQPEAARGIAQATAILKRSGLSPSVNAKYMKALAAGNKVMERAVYDMATTILETTGLTWDQMGYTPILSESIKDYVILQKN